MRSKESNTPVILISTLNKAMRHDVLDQMLMPARNIKIDSTRPKSDKEFIKAVKEKLISFYNITPRNKYRGAKQVEYRYLTMWIARKYTKMSYSQIGGLFNKDHATAIHAVTQINNRLSYDKEFIKKVNYIEYII